MYYSASVLRSVELWLVYKSTRALFSICIQSYIVVFILHIRTYMSSLLLNRSCLHVLRLLLVFLMYSGGCRDIPPVPLGDRYPYPYPNAQSLSLPFFAFQSSLHPFDALASCRYPANALIHTPGSGTLIVFCNCSSDRQTYGLLSNEYYWQNSKPWPCAWPCAVI